MKIIIIQQIVLPFIMKFIEDLLTKENLEVWLDKLFDFVEEMVKDSRTKVDDKIVLPIIEQMRKQLGV